MTAKGGLLLLPHLNSYKHCHNPIWWAEHQGEILHLICDSISMHYPWLHKPEAVCHLGHNPAWIGSHFHTGIAAFRCCITGRQDVRTRTGNTAGKTPSSSLSKCKLKTWLSRPLLSCFRSCIANATSLLFASMNCEMCSVEVQLKVEAKMQGQRGRTSVFRCLVSMDTSMDASPGSEKRMPGVRPPLRMRIAALLPSS